MITVQAGDEQVGNRLRDTSVFGTKAGSSGELDQKLLESQELLESSQQLPESMAAKQNASNLLSVPTATRGRLPREWRPDLSESTPLLLLGQTAPLPSFSGGLPRGRE